MPILGLFETKAESRRRRNIDDMARGRGPSLARQQLLEGMRRTQQGMQSAAYGSRGNQQLAMRNALNAGAQVAADTNQQAANARMQEQLWAMGEQGRIAKEQADGINQAIFGVASAIGNAATGGGLGAAQAASGAAGGGGGWAAPGRANLMSRSTPMSQVYGSLDAQFGAPGTVTNEMLLSDERVKAAAAAGNERARRMLDDYARLVRTRQFQDDLGQAVRQGYAEGLGGVLGDQVVDLLNRSRVRDVLRSVAPTEFNYRDPDQPGARDGRRLGVMAQDLERTELGRQMTQRGPDGNLRIDPAAATGALLAAASDLQQRMDRLESRTMPSGSGEYFTGVDAEAEAKKRQELEAERRRQENSLRAISPVMGDSLPPVRRGDPRDGYEVKGPPKDVVDGPVTGIYTPAINPFHNDPDDLRDIDVDQRDPLEDLERLSRVPMMGVRTPIVPESQLRRNPSLLFQRLRRIFREQGLEIGPHRTGNYGLSSRREI